MTNPVINKIYIIKELLAVAKELVAGRVMEPERRAIISNLFKSNDPGVRGIVSLSLRIWNIDKVNWPATKREMAKLSSGRMAVRKIEALPYFREIQGGGYRMLMDTVGNANEMQITKQWEAMGVVLDTISEEQAEHYAENLVP